MKTLENKVAIVTGAGKGIGRAIAEGYAEAGAIVCCAARTLNDLENVVANIQKQGGQGLAIQTDVTQLDQVQQMYQTVEKAYGGFDILVINAGGGIEKSSIEESNPEKWVQTIELNLISAYYCGKEAVPYLKARGGGKIITLGSGMGYRGNPIDSSYSCAKAGLWMFTRLLAEELFEFNISVNELIPGPVNTPNTQMMGDQTNSQSVFSVSSEWKKEPEDVLPLALFLASQPLIGPSAQSFSLIRRAL